MGNKFLSIPFWILALITLGLFFKSWIGRDDSYAFPLLLLTLVFSTTAFGIWKKSRVADQIGRIIWGVMTIGAWLLTIISSQNCGQSGWCVYGVYVMFGISLMLSAILIVIMRQVRLFVGEFLKPNRGKIGLWLMLILLTIGEYWFLSMAEGGRQIFTWIPSFPVRLLEKLLGIFDPGIAGLSSVPVTWYLLACLIYFIITKIKRLVTK